MNKIQKFIKDNKLDLTDSGSGFNSTCTILAGFALYLNGDINDEDQVLDDIHEGGLYYLNPGQEEEFKRVFEFAFMNNYCNFWESPNAHSQYIFEDKEED